MNWPDVRAHHINAHLARLHGRPAPEREALHASDVPGGVINLVTGPRAELTEVLAAHYDVDALWYFADDGGGEAVERLSAENMKRTWVSAGRDWWDPSHGEGPEFLRHATQPKNIWVPYGA